MLAECAQISKRSMRRLPLSEDKSLTLSHKLEVKLLTELQNTEEQTASDLTSLKIIIVSNFNIDTL